MASFAPRTTTSSEALTVVTALIMTKLTLKEVKLIKSGDTDNDVQDLFGNFIVYTQITPDTKEEFLGSHAMFSLDVHGATNDKPGTPEGAWHPYKKGELYDIG